MDHGGEYRVTAGLPKCMSTHTPVVIVVINVSVLMFRALLSHTGSKHSKLSTQCVRGVQKGDVCGK